ncbi:MAG: two-component system, OmpR family, alkaline phosphatase synthesis response regulator PhoP [Candidatus Binatota bacterium]|jgi:phosphate regulon transcriptional regulator PhoB|nr:two-component system, OmpR family, alkaline phosphatase synthesis response regulator PhoP [Candidatus Binatota bacterium]
MADVKRTILVVEDEADIRDLVRYNLEQDGLAVLDAADGEIGMAIARRERPALVVLDLMLPGMNGLEVCRALRSTESTARIPILMLTARATETDKVLGLEMGADDYVTKPFSPRELVARVRAVLRRAYGVESDRPREIYERGRLRVDLDTYEVFLEGKPIALSLREFELLKFFLQYPDRVFTRPEILDLVWGQDTYVEPRTVDVHVRRLRERIERDDANPELILTVRGVGYKFKPDALVVPAGAERPRSGARRTAKA